MSANTLAVLASASGSILPLRGDMAVTLNFTPNEAFDVVLRTTDKSTFSVSSTTALFIGIDGVKSSTITFGGKIGLWVNLRYNIDDAVWEIAESNLVTGETIPTSTGGTGDGTGVGTGIRELVVTHPDSNGKILLDGLVSNNFLVEMTANATLLNMTNFVPGEEITVIYRQDATGSRLLAHDTLFAQPNSQPVNLTTTAHALDLIKYNAYQDTDGSMGYMVRPDTLAYGKITTLAKIGNREFFMLGGAAAQGAFNLVQKDQTVYIIRDGLGAECTGSIVGIDDSALAAGTPSPHYVVAGVAVNGRRPILALLATTRPAYGKALLNFEACLTVEIRDLVLRDARNADGDARGIAPNTSTQHMIIRNVDILNCCNGVLWGNDAWHGEVTLIDTLLDANGVGIDGVGTNGTTKGYTHNIYGGHNEGTHTHLRTTVSNAVDGHNIKSRSGITRLDQVKTFNSQKGRELNLPVGGKLYATNCWFHKYTNTSQGNMIGIGEETIDTARDREYIFTNVLFQNDYGLPGQDATFITNFDRTVPMHFVDCQFVGDYVNSMQSDPNSDPQYAGMVTVNGLRYYPSAPPVFTFTGGPLGPLLTPGKPDNVQMTPVTA